MLRTVGHSFALSVKANAECGMRHPYRRPGSMVDTLASLG
jgi:hypothetical protein